MPPRSWLPLASLASGKASGAAGKDSFASIENLTGGGGGDTLTGDSNVNVIDGGAGSDTINGGDGNDSLRGGLGDDKLTGGNGADFADYSDQNTAVRANLATGKASGAAGNDTLTAIESLVAVGIAGKRIGTVTSGQVLNLIKGVGSLTCRRSSGQRGSHTIRCSSEICGVCAAATNHQIVAEAAAK